MPVTTLDPYDINDLVSGTGQGPLMPGGGALNYRAMTQGQPRGTSLLNFMQNMFGITPAAAAEAPNPYDALKNPTPVNPALQGPVFADQTPTGPVNQVQPPVVSPAFQQPARPASVSPSGLPLAPGSESPASLAQFGPNPYMPTPYGGGSVGPGAPAVNAQRGRPAGPLSGGGTGGAGGVGATSNPRFGLLPGGYEVSGGGHTPYISALNLGSLFGGGQQAPTNPNAPAAAAQPVSAIRRTPGPLARNLGYGPYQKGLGPDWSDIYAARSHSGFQ